MKLHFIKDDWFVNNKTPKFKRCIVYCFPSSIPTDAGDYGYIKYIDDINNNASTTPYGGENARLVTGLENDKTGDSIVLMTPESSGYVGINKMNPTCDLDCRWNGSKNADPY